MFVICKVDRVDKMDRMDRMDRICRMDRISYSGQDDCFPWGIQFKVPKGMQRCYVLITFVEGDIVDEVVDLGLDKGLLGGDEGFVCCEEINTAF